MTPHEGAAATAVDYDPFAGSPPSPAVPTTAAQREVWLASRLDPEASLAYNEAIHLTFRGVPDLPALEAALQDVVDRHDALRATFSEDGEHQFITDRLLLPLVTHDLSRLPPFDSDARLMAAWSRIVTTPFDLVDGPLVRADLFRLADDRHIVTLSAHHIVCDGWSFGVIVRDLAALYAHRTGQGAMPPPASAFSTFARHEAAHADTVEARDDDAYWLRRLAGTLPVLDLPTDRPRPRRRRFASRREDRTIASAELPAIRHLGARHGASLYATLLAGFALLLRRLTGQDDVIVGIPTAGQAADGLDTLVGHAVNVLPLRARVTGDLTFSALLRTLRGDLLDAFGHQRTTLGHLLGQLALPRDPARLPLVSVLFNLDACMDDTTARFPGLRFDVAAVPREYENFELFVNAVQTGDGLRLECQYSAELFDGATVQGWLDAYATLMRHAALAPDVPAMTLPLVSDAVYRELAALQPAPTPFPELRLAHEFFERQVDRAPERAAVRHADRTLSYAALESRANRVANALRDRGIGHGDLVGLCVGRSVDMLAAVLGTLKAGAGYVPLDPAFPPDRLAFMATDAALAALLVDDRTPVPFAFPGGRVMALDGDEVAAASFERPERDRRAATPDSVAYVIFTSGSTGRPKGVRVPHRAAANFLTAMQRVPGIAPDDRLVAVTTLSFDIAFMELLLPLTSGAEVVIAGRDDVRDGAQLRRLIEDSDATMMQATPAGWRLLVEAGWQGRPAFRAVSGGEPLPVDLAEALLERCGEVWNGYGPTETTVYSTFWRVSDPRSGIYIGRPIANTTVHVLDDHGMPCPLGVPGELYVGGAGVTLGYLDRPDLTAERFVTDPWSDMPDSRMYRTGDKGRWLSNGLLEHLGRLDFQVKVRGYRIEPGEIEAALADSPDLARALVIAREDRPGDVRLVAYVVARPGRTVDEDGLRGRLRSRLPDYMLPQHIVVLPAMPLLPNGKTDRAALPPPMAPSATERGERIAPRGDAERRVAAAMETVLCLPDLDVRDDFFALGGHSLLAAQLTARLNREFGVSLSFRTLFDAPSIEQLAATLQTLSGHEAEAVEPIVARETQDRAPLSLMQRRLWALETMQPGRVTYNAPSAHRLRGQLDEHAFEMAFQALIQRQPAMRTAFQEHDGEIVQVVQPRLEHRLFPAEDLSHLAPPEREARLMARLQQLTDTPFDLGVAPLFSARLFRLADDEHALFFMPHHIIWDGWSFDIFCNELSSLYRAFAAGDASPLAPLAVTYGDFAQWHTRWLQTPAFEAQLDVWRDRLAGMGAIRPLPTDHPRRPGMSGLGRTQWIRVDRDTTQALHEVARQADATLNMTLLALYYAMLSSSAGQRDLVVGTPVRGRNQPELEAVMGYFNNLLPLHVHVDPSLSFVEFVRQVKRIALDAFGHPDVPLEYLQRELKIGHGSGATLYQALFSFQDARQRTIDWGGLAHEQILLFQSAATEDMGLWFLENHAGMVGGVTYNADLLRDDTARLMRERYLGMMHTVIRDPSIAVGCLIAATGDERDRMRAWNADPTDAPRNVLDAIDAHVAASPGDVALRLDGRAVTYATLQAHSLRLARAMIERGARPGRTLGLCVAPGETHLIALLAAMRTGATVLMLDRAAPAAHLRDVVTDARATLMVGDAALETLLDWPADCAVWTDRAIGDDGDPMPRPAVADEAPLIAWYGVGADARARGAALSWNATARLVDVLGGLVAPSPGQTVSGDASPADPFSVLAPLVALTRGATWVGDSPHGRADVRVVCAGPMPRLERGQEAWHLFGEASVAPVITLGRTALDGEGVHEGRPMPGCATSIVDDDGEPCPIGAAGAIVVSGPAIAQPFGRRAHPQHGASGTHATGYSGRWLGAGRVQVLGRDGRRVRCHGMDIEPAAIETALLARPGIVKALAVARHDTAGTVRVDAYVVGAPGIPVDAAQLRAALADTLPSWAMPTHLAALEAFPLLPHGEIDTDALPLPAPVGTDAVDHDLTPRTDQERLLASVWQELLGMPRVRTSDNFFDVGGHSLLAVDMATRVHKLTGIPMNLLDIANGTLGTLAADLAATPPAASTKPRGFFGRLLHRR
ncbi:amino acid adenylation domain-containing protein [Luteibacter sp. PPL552]